MSVSDHQPEISHESSENSRVEDPVLAEYQAAVDDRYFEPIEAVKATIRNKLEAPWPIHPLKIAARLVAISELHEDRLELRTLRQCRGLERERAAASYYGQFGRISVEDLTASPEPHQAEPLSEVS